MSIRQFISNVMELPKAINVVNETIGGGEMTHTPELLRIIEQNELDKTLRCVRLVDSNGVFALAVPEKYGALVAAAPDMLAVLEKLSSLLVDGEEYVPLELREELTTAIRKARGEE